MGECDKWENVCAGPAQGLEHRAVSADLQHRVPSTSHGASTAQGHMSLYARPEKEFLSSQWRPPGTEGSSTTWRGAKSLPFSLALNGLMASENLYCKSQSHVHPGQTGLFQHVIKLELSRVNFENPNLYQMWAPLFQSVHLQKEVNDPHRVTVKMKWDHARGTPALHMVDTNLPMILELNSIN